MQVGPSHAMPVGPSHAMAELLRYVGERDAREAIVHPFMLYKLSNWRLSSAATESPASERHDASYYDVTSVRELEISSAPMVRTGDIVYVECDRFDDFVRDLLPLMQSRIIVATGKLHIPAVARSSAADCVLAHRNVAFWLSQNPVYENHPKYIGVPYGVILENLPALRAEILKPQLPREERVVHCGLSRSHPDREDLLPLQDLRMPLDEFYALLHRSAGVISPQGDRPDCYRHVEAILLGCTPIGTLPSSYSELYPEYTYLNASRAAVQEIATSRKPPPRLPRIEDHDRWRFLQDPWIRKVQALQVQVRGSTSLLRGTESDDREENPECV